MLSNMGGVEIDPGSGKSPALSVFAVSTATHSSGLIVQSAVLLESGGSNIARVAPTMGDFALQPSVTWPDKLPSDEGTPILKSAPSGWLVNGNSGAKRCAARLVPPPVTARS